MKHNVTASASMSALKLANAPTCAALALTSALAFAFAFSAPARAEFLYTQTFTVNKPIADFGEYVTAPNLSGISGVLSDVNVGINLVAPAGDSVWSGDYYASLAHGTGFAVLLNRIGKTNTDPWGSGHNGLNIILDDQALAGDVHLAPYDTAQSSPAALTGTWAPDGRQTDPAHVIDTDAHTGTGAATLASFNGLSANGEWRLFISDESPGGKAVLSSWSLSLTLVPASGAPLAIVSGATLTTTSTQTLDNALVNQGLIVVSQGETLTFTGNVTGAGNFQGNVVFNGSYSPGNSPAAVTFTGDLTLGPDNILTMEIGGTTPGTGYDTLHVTGNLLLGGTLNIVFINGFTPGSTDSFQFFSAGSIGGSFAQLTLPEGFVAAGDVLNGGTFSASAIPEPATLALLAGLSVLALIIRRRMFRRNQVRSDTGSIIS